MKIILNLFILLFVFNCSNLKNVTEKSVPYVSLNVINERYSLILKHNFDKNFTKFNDKLDKFKVDSKITFTKQDTLSHNGSNNLSILSGQVTFKIYNTSKSILIKSGKIDSSVNIGNVSSFYGIDENLNFTKERLTQYLASKLYKRIMLSIQ
tara:strand:+ start:101 stop:556 length:456 start_codon:yes stop_codon:yes gene_type:complete